MDSKTKTISLAHGAGGSLTQKLLDDIIVPSFKNRSFKGGLGLNDLDDGGTIPVQDYEIVATTDAHTVSPLFFPGGDLGTLAACGTINDVAVMGAEPVAMTSAVVMEEGFLISDFKKILNSMNKILNETNVSLISGDTKVMPKGTLDGIIISTTGIGIAKRGTVIVDSGLRPGNKLIISGSIGDHGIALVSKREGLSFETDLISDCAPVNEIIKAAMKPGGITAMKDPTRGGVAACLNEFASKSNVSIWIDEEILPIKNAVKAACDMLGFDPLTITCEGKVVIGVEKDLAEETLNLIKKTKYGKEARIIGEVKTERPGYVILKTFIGGKRIIEMPRGEPIPRVC
ncbi:MAG: hydrogenase expression/formation protein HypE [Candidatus Lokiarchaeota archaeon]|nr:hydrogenase expression/formation protein HypE [Candidatus Lokiarchaeota archaeon]